MRILKVIHGFPPDYMTGSEVYSYHIVQELRKRDVDTFVFTRVENQFDDNYRIYDEDYKGIPIRRINKVKRDYQYEEKVFDPQIDNLFKEYLKEVKPDIVHIGHLSHLSTNIIPITKKEHRLPIVFTIHDFWMFCIRGQLINHKKQICPGPDPSTCQKCSPFTTEIEDIESVFSHMREIMDMVDIFLSPSHTLRDFFINQGISKTKVIYSKYGFNIEKVTFSPKSFNANSKIRFGFIGRVIPTKGITVMIDAFKDLKHTHLDIYGNIDIGKRFIEHDNIHFKGSYHNDKIDEVLQKIDVLIVPSIWYENSPLVIQEAFLAGTPVITSELGGMRELVKDGENGFTFEAGNSEALKAIVSKIIDAPQILNRLRHSRDQVRDIKTEAEEMIKIYQELVKTTLRNV